MVIRDCLNRDQCSYGKTLPRDVICKYFWLSGVPIRDSDRAKALEASIVHYHSVTNLKNQV